MSTSDLEILYRRRRDAMVRLARLLTGSPAVAEEVVQEAFLKMQQQDHTPRNPEGYLRTTVANLARSHLRRLRLERRVAPDAPVATCIPEVDETWGAVCQLPFRHRAVLVLRFYEDLAEPDIAQVLGCRVGTVKSRLHRALGTLRDELS